MIYAYEDSNPRYEEMLKVGYTAIDVETRVVQQYPTLKPGERPYTIRFAESAVRSDGSSFMDHEVHDNLEKNGFYRLRDASGKKTEWFRCTVDDVRAAWLAVRDRTENVERRTLDFKMRPEQEQAVEKTMAFYRRAETGAHLAPKFLWNAKMRFGKTFATYELAKRMGFRRVLVLTFKPAVRTAWYDDLTEHVDFEGWQFVTRDGMQYEEADPARPIVCFGSFQDFLMPDRGTGQIKPRNEWVHLEDWDLVVFDEYHFGAWNDNARSLFRQEDEDELNTVSEDTVDTSVGCTNTGNEVDEGDLPIATKYYLFLSGTPFRALNSGEFIEDQVFNWTYSDEQRAKRNWEGPDNPYESLPRMVMLTYQMPKEIHDIALGGEFDSFDLNAFFEARDEGDDAEFVLKDYVQKWLDLIRGAYLPSSVDDLKLGAERPPMPYSDTRLLNVLNHTLWYLPRVNSCFAMRNLLAEKQNVFFHDYTVNVCAGTAAGIGPAALDKVQETMQDPLRSKTITLTCGKLTTGVTVRPWTGIFMLTNMRSPESYFQAAFRVQSPWVIDGEHGREIEKRECYVFDFALDRALRMVSSYSLRLSVDGTGPEQKVGEFIDFLPVLAYDGSTMHQVSASEILDIAMAGTSATLLARRWESALLVNVDNDTLRRLMGNEDAMRALMNIEGFRALGGDILETIVNRSEGIKKAKRERQDMTSEEHRELSEEERELRGKRKQVQEKLIKFATRIPVFMYLTDFREQCLKDVITQLEPGLFKKVTGLTVPDFDLLVSLGVFNDGLMNDAVYKFRRYEDSSLEYTGINKHEGERVGLFDTTLSEFDYLQMKQEETLRGGAVTDADAGIRAPRRAVRIVDSTSDGKPLTVDAVVTNGGNDWVVASLRKGGFRFVDHRDERGNLWVIGGRAIEDRLKPLFDHGAGFKFKAGGTKVTHGKDAWWLSGYPERQDVAAKNDEEPVITQDQLDALDAGGIVFHRAFGRGVIDSIDSGQITVTFDDDRKRERAFIYPGTFFQGLLRIG